MFRDIAAFHKKFGLAPVAEKPVTLPPELLRFRVQFMKEELEEYEHAAANGDLEGQLDALVDLVYVAMGTAFLQRFPFYSAWCRVQAANMAKIRAERADQSKRGSTFDVVKPPGWTAPDHANLVVGEHAILMFDGDTADDE